MEILLKDGIKHTIFSNVRGLMFSDGKTPGHILASDCSGFFDVALKDSVYVVYISDAGEIIMLQNVGRGWRKTVVLKSRNGTIDIFGIRLIVAEQTLNLIYGLRHNSENLIVHQTVPGGTPQVVTSAYGEKFFVRRDSGGCVYTITEAAQDIWHFCFMRNGVWSSSEELISDCCVEDVMTDGYKSFCVLFKNKDGCFARCGDTEFEISGEDPCLIKHEQEFKVIAERSGRVYCTSSSGESLQITSETVKKYILRLPESGEYAVCERCSGNLIHGIPRLILVDRSKPSAVCINDSAKLELTKRIMELEARVTRLENRETEVKP